MGSGAGVVVSAEVMFAAHRSPLVIKRQVVFLFHSSFLF